jgi:arylsulfatase A-like enzyme
LKAAENFASTTSGPWFLWVHVWPPHSPYLAGRSLYKFLPERVLDTRTSQQLYDNRFYTPDQQVTIDKLRLRYDESIFNLDNELGDFFDSIKNRGITGNTVIAISADHGEIFEKGYHEHGGAGCNSLYQPLIHIPLIVKLPGQEIGRRVSAAAEQTDIAPTLLNLIGAPVPKWMEGESLVRAMNDGFDSEKPKFSMNLEKCNVKKPISDGSIAIIRDKYKFIYYPKNGQSELYELNADPREKKNIVGAAALREELYSLIKDKINAKR